jgi:hypothetical protein
MKGFLEDPLSNEVIKAARTWYGRVKGMYFTWSLLD